MTALQATLNIIADTLTEHGQRLDRIERVQASMLKVLQSMEGRLQGMANHDERLADLEQRVVKLERQRAK